MEENHWINSADQPSQHFGSLVWTCGMCLRALPGHWNRNGGDEEAQSPGGQLFLRQFEFATALWGKNQDLFT